MNISTQFYFSLEKLKGLIAHFENHPAAGGNKTLKGFVFTPGCDKKSKQCCFAFPLYTDSTRALQSEDDGAFLLQNMSFNPGCPYPPPC